ncbi:flagellar basal body rod protein [Cytobacillus sp. S13-E01]|uniref:lmo0954 family membrane protein n=1 Tax=Cytobacillus sp. S13-E01 TaxID=3031326 RepID=UPI0023D812A5|nr:flagellar basal body rod protein [Cytobacillus sp. S13-E01]MDF0725857.1 flagellar basal body rod protein [Cytobacillus sp. S13-E01]
MKKFGLLIIGAISALVLLGNVGPVIGLAISLVIMYFAFKGFMKTDSTAKKVMWAVIGLIALAASASNVPAIIGIAAAYVLYVVYKKWNSTKETVVKEDSDPFTNFERQWSELKKEY